MFNSKTWESYDLRIKKDILENGTFGPKPTENAICKIEVTNVKSKNNLISEYLNESLEQSITITIGEANTAVDREIDKCLLTMHKGEISSATIQILSHYSDIDLSFEIKLCQFDTRGYIYQWTAEEKCKMALSHKEKGVELFRNGRFIDASHRFSKGLKLLLSIPVPVDEIPDKIEDIVLTDLNSYKANLYNNLASCYSKENMYNTVVELCGKVLDMDKNNSKALCKRGFAYAGIRDYEKAKIDLVRVLDIDQDNKAAFEKLQYVNLNLSKQEANYASIVKKMFAK